MKLICLRCAKHRLVWSLHPRRFLMRAIAIMLTAFWFTGVHADGDKIGFTYKDAELTKVIEDYAKASGQKFIIDPNVKGKITIMNKEPVTVSEAFNQLSSAMALNSYAISKQDDVMVVSHARHI